MLSERKHSVYMLCHKGVTFN